MKVFGLNIWNDAYAVHPVELSKKARHRLVIITWHKEHGLNAALTCRHYGISRDSFYRWWRRFTASGPGGLEDASHRPKTVRAPIWRRNW